ncbi:MAG: tRNA (adenosine(37)-N6)-dimethylallyltransferase MiaA [Bacteroidota bacterium]
MKNSKKLLCVITGPTACGKTDLTIQLAKEYNTHIISADSRQFYKQLIIGAATPSANQLAIVPHYLIGQLSVEDSYNVYKFEQDALALCETLFQSHNIVFLTGGSGLYIDAACKGIDLLPDPDLEIRNSINTLFEEQGIEALQTKLQALDPIYYSNVDKLNPARLIRAIEVCLQTGKPYSSLRNQHQNSRPFNILKIVIDRPKEILHQRISQRTEQMIKDGLIDEVKSLIKFRNVNALNTVGYKEIFQYLDEAISLPQAIENIKTNTRRYAKRQLTWFRRDKDFLWINADELNTIKSIIETNLGNSPSL